VKASDATITVGEGWTGVMTLDACPVQIEGLVDGLSFYFRARFGHWTFSVASEIGGDPVSVSIGAAAGFHMAAAYGTEDFDASWMPERDAWRFVEQGIRAFRGQSLLPAGAA
jgi:hypothetical protein